MIAATFRTVLAQERFVCSPFSPVDALFSLVEQSFPALACCAVKLSQLDVISGDIRMTRFAKRILVPLTVEQHAALRSRTVSLGVPVTEQIRRAVSLMLFAEQKPRKKSSTKPSAEQELFFQ